MGHPVNSSERIAVREGLHEADICVNIFGYFEWQVPITLHRPEAGLADAFLFGLASECRRLWI